MPSEVLGKLIASEVELNFELKAEQLDRIKKVASLLKLKTFIIDAQNDKINIIACNLSENDTYMQESMNEIPGGNINVDTKVVFDIQNILYFFA